jgi:spermidine/putrescine-binding protein
MREPMTRSTTVKQVYAAIRPYIRTFNNAEYKDALANGDACVVMGYSGDILGARPIAAAIEAARGHRQARAGHPLRDPEGRCAALD